ncbi:lactonase family protein [Curtobacterium herbarum]|uniref:Lactonase family protein n=1 Tax=Curtobacterium herbarum TaxID=150122 RepID=A0ABN1Z8G1_9MICO|nr:beta-propeller fold lactonase family protein [Curtobacterium herbarum]MBM7476484.1 6-phosphogluconolactonase (cycloisomerase 2 family) [Curtobacterium herbarum]MCS6543952.1 lactonase family protein [Curtobacterium herbarum]
MSLPPLNLLIGSYTATGGGNATGISIVSGGLVSTIAVLDDPAFLAVDGDRVYAVSETLDGGVHAFRRSGSALEHLWDAPAGGDAPCHVRVDGSGALVVTNYVSGTVTAISLAAAEAYAVSTADGGAAVHGVGGQGAGVSAVLPDAALATEVLPDAIGPDESRQEGPHAHQSIATPDGTVLVADLGGDALHEFRIRADAGSVSIEPVRVHHVTPGAGPRHMDWVRRGHGAADADGDAGAGGGVDGGGAAGAGVDLIVAGELDGRVYRLRRDESGSFREVCATSVLDGPGVPSLLSHLEVDERGLVTVAVRGRDQIVVLDTADDGLRVVGAASAGGLWPRHFARVPGYLLVANQRSDAVAVLPVGDDGVPGEAVGQIAVGSPACVIPLE